MNSIFLAVRNIRRNQRRSLVTGAAVGIGGAVMLLLSGFVAQLVFSYQTVTVQSRGHLTLYREGFYDFGAGDPAAYGIADYAKIVDQIREDPVLAPLVVVATPSQQVFGVASYDPAERSKVFLGTGLVPSDQDHMRAWDGFGLGIGRAPEAVDMSDEITQRGFVGPGLARILGLCTALGLEQCPTLPPSTAAAKPGAGTAADADMIRSLGAAETPTVPSNLKSINLLASTAGGAPNVVLMDVVAAQSQGFKGLDDSAVIMTLPLAQQLVYGRGIHKVSAITIQLRHTSDIPIARKRLMNILAGEHLEIYDFKQLDPLYGQIVGLYSGIFIFVMLAMAAVTLFTVVNTVSMNVMERIAEIGTMRALGVRRSAIRSQYLAEGLILGSIGATGGLIAGGAIALLLNGSGAHWTPPGASHSVAFHLDLTATPIQLAAPWMILVVVAGIASVSPASRAARMNVVAALRHV
ncbi:ABC transporter permease [Nguyenibacter vanlangensis]|uniref:ABC transporter permease n=1 Tax=Nguyenibacter vanlangensis TaxID=1216886 RepID=A0A7Y7ITB5_9PROT|nr:FtsX-like permease family protein [Nguyenibacter vanlangensis]NVN09777.1 ABC transporter permease [Nguyenibacter vanlangensis]